MRKRTLAALVAALMLLAGSASAQTVKHRYQSASPDDPTKEISSGEWNDSHVFAGGADENLMCRDTAETDGWAWCTVDDFTADGTPDGATDYVLTWDDSAGGHKKVLLDDLPGGSGGYATIDDEDTPLTQRTTLNFEGAGVTCADDTDQTTCTIPGGGSAKPFLERTANQSMNAGTGTIATRDFRNGRPVLDFDASTDECDYFTATLPVGYAGGGITVTFPFMATTATSGSVVFRSTFERYDAGSDLDADGFGTEVTSSATTTSATSGAPIYISIAHTHGAQIDSLVAGEMFRHRLCRDADHASDTMAGDAEVPGISYFEP